jgi:type IV secretory pathway VirB2 component (pilin)
MHAFCETLLKIHGGIAASAIGAFYFYSDRTEGFVSSLNGTTAVLAELRRRLTGELAEELEPVFENPGSVPSPILMPGEAGIDRGAYVERAVNPIGSEAYREAVRECLDDHSNSIADYRSLSLACDCWSSWSHKLSWILLTLFAWEIIVLAILWMDKTEVFGLADWAMHVTWTITGLLIALAFLAAACRLRYYSRVSRMRLKHGQL